MKKFVLSLRHMPKISLAFVLSCLFAVLFTSTTSLSAYAMLRSGVATVSHVTTPASSDWSMVDVNAQHTNYNGNEKTLSTSNVSHLKLKWTLPVSALSVFQTIVAGGVLYSYDYKSISAQNATTGALKWTTQIGNFNLNFPTPLVANGYVYAYGSDIHSSTLQLVALNASTGNIVWRTVLGNNGPSSSSGLTYSNGVIYTGATPTNGDGIVDSINAQTGKILHTFDTQVGEDVWSAPSVANGILYVRTLNTVVAFNISTGARLWSVAHGGQTSSDSGVTISNNLAIYSEEFMTYTSGDKLQYHTELYALDAQTGAQKWAVLGTAGPFLSNIAVANGVVYVKGSDITAYNETTGKVIWTVSAGSSSSPSQGIAVANGVVYSVQWINNGATVSLLALNASTGHQLWSYYYKSGLLYCPIVANGMVYVGDSHNILAFGLS